MANVNLNVGQDRIDAGHESSDNYVESMENIRSNLDVQSGEGTTLGTMANAEVAMTDLDTIERSNPSVNNPSNLDLNAVHDRIAAARAAGSRYMEQMERDREEIDSDARLR